MKDRNAFRFAFFGASIGAAISAAPLGAQTTKSDARCVEGVYTLEEFKRDGEIFRRPLMSGRYVLSEGQIIWIFNDRTQLSKLTSTTAFGRYTVDQSSFAYGYDEYDAYTQTDAGLSVNRKVPWQGLGTIRF